MLGTHQFLLLWGDLERDLGGDLGGGGLTKTQKYQTKSVIFHLVVG